MHEEGKHAENCKEIFALLSEYLDAELSARTCAEIEAHLKDCPPCIEFLESLKRTVALCKGFNPEECPGPLPDKQRSELMEAYRKMLAARKSQAGEAQAS